jgi:fructokinase
MDGGKSMIAGEYHYDHHIVIFGEVLFDCFDDGSRVLGGAPFNVAWNLKALGVHPLMITRIGNDELGNEIMAAMHDWGLSTDGVQVDDEHSTGTVSVHIENNEPHFEIVDSVAYDFIDQQQLPYLPVNGILYHGSLALRNMNSRMALGNVLTQMKARIFIDINLRPPWWDEATVQMISRTAHWIKLNQHELEVLTHADNEQSRIIEFFSGADNLKELILTQGEQGAVSITPEGELHRVEPNKNQNFVDAVGAGDAFSSVMLLGKHLSWSTEVTMQRAQEFASAVVGLRGATTTDKQFYQDFVERWDIEPEKV